jgi:hypothetical protein
VAGLHHPGSWPEGPSLPSATLIFCNDGSVVRVYVHAWRSSSDHMFVVHSSWPWSPRGGRGSKAKLPLEHCSIAAVGCASGCAKHQFCCAANHVEGHKEAHGQHWQPSHATPGPHLGQGMNGCLCVCLCVWVPYSLRTELT